jgi:hypothetical protein
MAILYSDASGALLRLVGTPNEGDFPAPAGAASTLTFDESTNAATVASLLAEWSAYRLVSGQLSRGGQAVTIAAPSAAYTQRQQVYQQAQQILSDMDAYLALSSPTNAQTVAMFQEQLRAFRWVLRHLVLGQ